MARAEYGSDVVVDLMRAFGIEYVALNPGATFRGLHDSLVNYGGNTRPELILCCHEEIAVALAHGYAKATGKLMAAAVHDVVGLQHACSAIFNAFCDRAPVFVVGATGPMDATKRRPWIDWIHTALVQGQQVRDYVKWDDQPASIAAIPEAFTRAWRLASTPPRGPVYLCLDAALQEEALTGPMAIPDPGRFAPPAPPQAEGRALETAARLLAEAASPVIVVEALARAPEALAALRRLAERLAAPVVDTSQSSRGRPSFPGSHPLDATDERENALREADVILALDVEDYLGALGTTDRATRRVRSLAAPSMKLISISLNDYAFRSWAHTFQSLVPVDVPIAADTAVALPTLDALVEDRLRHDRRAPERQARLERCRRGHAARQGEWRAAVDARRTARPLALPVLAAEVWAAIAGEDWVLTNGVAGGWARRLWDWQPERAFGGSGGAGLGYGLPASLGMALAFRNTSRLCVNLQSEGDLLYVASAFYTAAHHRLPLLTVICNNGTYYNDEMHQEAVARERGRPVERKTVGIRIEDPAPDYGRIAAAFGIHAEGPIDDAAALGPALKRALRVVKEERRPAVLDVLTGVA
ncbi:MAG TPA: thiamine pyrophosphate-binding protein [Methylomirabilota bacterium]|nr:thiamine pyrophosphate-binding protein [Methylomirabilota bacterium]